MAKHPRIAMVSRLTMILLLVGVLAPPPASATAQTNLTHCRVVAIKSLANNRYVSAELAYGGSSYGMLRARATSVGPWERFYYCSSPPPHGAGIEQIKSYRNDLYVSAEFGYSYGSFGMLRARAASFGEWERWVVDGCGSGCATIRSTTLLKGRYVSAELGYEGSFYGMLRARANTVGPWEKFSIHTLAVIPGD